LPNFPLFFKNFKEKPFETLDNLDLKYFGFQFNLLRNDEKLRKALFNIFFLIPLIAWLLLGADSTADQVANMMVNIPNFLTQKITLNELLKIYNSYYGLGTHWSASVIYSLLFIGISKHLSDKLDIRNSLNLSLTTGFVGITIATFEFYWQFSYYYFQNQAWILTFKFPQARILTQNIMFMAVGMIVLLGLNYKVVKLNINRLTVAFFLITIGLCLLWWYYPFQTQKLTVHIEGYGAWTSSQRFPQTMYTIQPNVNVAYGKMYHIEDPGVHLLNNLLKIVMTLSFYSLFKIKKKEEKL